MTPQRVWILLVLIVVVASGGSYFLYSSREVEHQLRVQKEQELAAKSAELAEIQTQITSLTDEKKELEETLNTKIENLNALVKEYSDTMKSRADKITALVGENETLAGEKEKLSSAIDALKSKVQALEKEKGDLFSQVQKFQEHAASNEEEDNRESMREGPASETKTVKLGNIVVQKSGSTATVQSVNKVYGFLVVNAGTQDGLRKDSVINIVRGNKLIGRAVVQQAREHLSAAVLLPDGPKKEIQVGDQISIL